MDLLRELKNVRDDLEIYVVNKNITVKKHMAPGDEYHFYDLINSADKEIMGRIEFIKLGIERARKQGKTIGRPRKSKLDEKRKEIMAFKSIGMTNTEIASSMGVNESTLYRWFNEFK